MRLLLDESLPRPLRRELRGHDVVTVPEMGWGGRTNGDLLRLAKARFDAFLTADQNLEYQQNLSVADIPVIVLCSRTNRLQDLRPLIPKLLSVLGEQLEPGSLIQISA